MAFPARAVLGHVWFPKARYMAIHEKVVSSRGDAGKIYILSVPARGGTKMR